MWRWEGRLGLALLGSIVLGGLFGYGFTHHQTLNTSLRREQVELAEQREGWVTNHYLLQISATKELPQGLTLSVGSGGQGWEESVLEPRQIRPPLLGERELELTIKVPAVRLPRVVTPVNIQVTVPEEAATLGIRANIFRPQ